MSGSPRRHCIQLEEDISGQFRVTVPDTEELDQLRTRGGVYRRGLYTAGNRGNAPLEEKLNPCPRLHVNPPWNQWIRTMPGGPLKKFIEELGNKLA